MTGPLSLDERRGYTRGYTAGEKRRHREVAAERDRTTAAVELLDCLVAGLIASGVSLDAVLDLQIEGARARAE